MNTLENQVTSNIWVRKLLRSALLGGACMVPLATWPAAAQDADQSMETVVVTGLRGSLQKDLDIKRDSLGLVDAISAEDIGKFPDSNLAAAMQRIPGVSISRASNMGYSTTGASTQPTTTGDATSITVRGFGPNFNDTLYDGRTISTAVGSRAFDFSAVSSDFVQEIDILKSPDATLSAGALGATINVKFPKPLDHPGLKFVASASTTYSPEDGHPTPNGDVLFSDTFANDTFGILADVAFTDTKTLANHDSTQGWEGTHLDPCQLAGATTACGATLTPNTAVNNWYLQDYGVYQEHDNEQRINGRFVTQWHPSDNVLITLNDDYARDMLHQDQYGYSIWFNQGSLRNVQTASDGTVINFVQPGTPTDFQGQFNGQTQQTNEIGFNVKWDVNSKLSVVLDGDTSLSSLNPGGQLTSIDSDVGYGPSKAGGTNGTNVGIVIGSGHTLAYPSGIGPNGNASMFIDNGLIGSHVLPITIDENRNLVNQVKLEGDWTEGKLQIKAGFQFVGNHFNTRAYNDFTNNDWQAYSGYGSLSNNFFQLSDTCTTAFPCPAGNPADPYLGQPAGVALNQSWFTKSFSTAGLFRVGTAPATCRRASCNSIHSRCSTICRAWATRRRRSSRVTMALREGAVILHLTAFTARFWSRALTSRSSKTTIRDM